MSDAEVSVEPAREEPPLDIRNLVVRAAWSLAALFALLVLVGVAFEKQLRALAVRAEQALGLAGLMLLVFAADSFTLPVPPDLALIIVANGPRHADWFWIVPLLGCVSTCGGLLGYVLGRQLIRLSAVDRVRRMVQGRHFELVRRYGSVAVAIGALTPIPFSITCYAAGTLAVPLRGFAFACALRIPRFVGYYLVFAYANRLSQLIGAG